jgi:hypothetical protein
MIKGKVVLKSLTLAWHLLCAEILIIYLHILIIKTFFLLPGKYLEHESECTYCFTAVVSLMALSA